MDNPLQPNNKQNKPVAPNQEAGNYSEEDMSLLQDQSALPTAAETKEPDSVSPEDAALLADQSDMTQPVTTASTDASLPTPLPAASKVVAEPEPVCEKKLVSASSTMSPSDFEKWAGQLWQQYFAGEARKLAEQQLMEYESNKAAATASAMRPFEEKLAAMQQRLEPLERLPQSLVETHNFCQNLSQQFKELPAQMAEAVQQEFSRFWQKEETRFQESLQERLSKIDGQIKEVSGQSRLPQEEWTAFWKQEEQRMQDSFQERFARVDTQIAQLSSQIGKLEENLHEFDTRCKELGDKSTSGYQSLIAEWWQQEEKRLQHDLQERLGKLDGQLAQFPSQIKELVHKEAAGLWQKEEKAWRQREEQGKAEIQQLHTQTDKIDNTLRREFEKLSQYLQTLQQKEAQQKQQVKELEDALQLKLKTMEKVYVDLQKKSEAHSAAKVSRATFGWTVALLFIGYLAVLVLMLAR